MTDISRGKLTEAELKIFESQPFRTRFFELHDKALEPEKIGLEVLENLVTAIAILEEADRDDAVNVFLRLFHDEFIASRRSIQDNPEPFRLLFKIERFSASIDIFPDSFLGAYFAAREAIAKSKDEYYEELGELLAIFIGNHFIHDVPLRIISCFPKGNEKLQEIKQKTVNLVATKTVDYENISHLTKGLAPELVQELENTRKELKSSVNYDLPNRIREIGREVLWRNTDIDPARTFADLDLEKDALIIADPERQHINVFCRALLESALCEQEKGNSEAAGKYMKRLEETYTKLDPIMQSECFLPYIPVYYSRLSVDVIKNAEYEKAVRILLECAYNFPHHEENIETFYVVLLSLPLREFALKMAEDEELGERLREYLSMLGGRLSGDKKMFHTHSGMQMFKAILDIQLALGFDHDAATAIKKIFPPSLDMDYLRPLLKIQLGEDNV